MTRDQLKVDSRRNLHDHVLENLDNTGVQRASCLPQQGAICGVLNERMFEEIGRVRA